MSAAQPESQNAPTTPPWEAKRPKRRGLVRKLIIWLIIAGVAGLVMMALQERPVEVETGMVARGPLTVYVSEEGKTRIRNRYIVAAPVGGSMQRVTLKPGDTVKAGETILTRIEPGIAPLLDVRAKTEAQARVNGATAGRSRAQEALGMSRTGLKYAETNLDRIKGTANSGILSAADRDNFQREVDLKNREVRSAEFALQVADYELEQAKAALVQLENPGGGAVMEIKAPVNGLVLRVQQESATIVAPGTAILEIGDPNDLEIEAEILSRDAVAIKPGAVVTVEQWGGEPVEARVRRVEPAAFTKVSALGVEEQRVLVLSDFTAQTAALKALGDRFRVEVRVAVWHSDDTLLVPSGALFREGSEWKTFLHDKDKKRAKSITVKAGRTDGKMTEVIEGLKVGDEVLMHPPDNVKDGTEVVKREEPK
ncbi:MAG: efflux RND transporter periplasmic adaptor subunit [Prosthecobacter sp.]